MLLGSGILAATSRAGSIGELVFLLACLGVALVVATVGALLRAFRRRLNR